MNDIIKEIEGYVEGEAEVMSTSQKTTLKALLYSGYKGEREHVLIELLKTMGEEEISPSPLVESFTSSFKDEPSVVYWRIKPEFYRAVRNKLFKEH